MSILIGTTSTTNVASRDRILLNAIQQSNVICMYTPALHDMNIVFDPDNTNLVFGKSGKSFRILQNNASIASLSTQSNVLYSSTRILNELHVSSNTNIGGVLHVALGIKTKGLTASNIHIDVHNTDTNPYANPHIYFSASNASLQKPYLTASTDGEVYMNGQLTVDYPQFSSISANNSISFTTPGRLTPYGGYTTLHVQNSGSLALFDGSACISQGLRVDGGASIGGGAAIGGGASIGGNAVVAGSLDVSGSVNVKNSVSVSNVYVESITNIYNDDYLLKFFHNNLIFNGKFICSNIETSNITAINGTSLSGGGGTSFVPNPTFTDVTIQNSSELNKPLLDVKQLQGINTQANIVDVKLLTHTNETLDAFFINNFGEVSIRTQAKQLGVLTLDASNNMSSPNGLYVNTVVAPVIVDNYGNVGIGTTITSNQLCIFDNALHPVQSSLLGLYSTQTPNDYISAYKTVLVQSSGNPENPENPEIYNSIQTRVFNVNNTGDVFANSIVASNATFPVLYAQTIVASAGTAENAANAINFSTASLSNISTLSCSNSTIQFIDAASIQTGNLVCTNNVSIGGIVIEEDNINFEFKTFGVSASNIVLSQTPASELSTPGKLIVRTDDQALSSIVSGVSGGAALGINVIGTSENCIRVTSAVRPTVQLYNSNANIMSYIGQTLFPTNFNDNQFLSTDLAVNSINKYGMYFGMNESDTSKAQFKVFNDGLNLMNYAMIVKKNAVNKPFIGIGVPNGDITNGSTYLLVPLASGQGSSGTPFNIYSIGSCYFGTANGHKSGQGLMVFDTGSGGGCRVGIGVTYPQSEFHVAGNAIITDTLSLGSGSARTVNGGNILQIHGSSSRSNCIFTSTSANTPINVGIGTTYPIYNLDVIGTMRIACNVQCDKDLTVHQSAFLNNVTIQGVLTATLARASSNQFNITGLSNVNVRSISVSNLTVINNIQGNISGSASLVTSNTQNAISALPFASNIGTSVPSQNAIYIGSQNTNLYIGTSILNSIANANNITIGNASSTLTINTTNPINISRSTIGTLTATNTIVGSVNGSSAFVTSPTQSDITSIPNVTQIATNQSTLTLGATGIINIGQKPLTATTSINVYGTMYTNGNVVSLSDRDIKRDLIPIYNPLERIARLNGYTYIRTDKEIENTHPIKRECGLIAQEVAAVLPEVIEMNTNDSLMSIAYGNMAGLFVESIKELMVHIEQLQDEVASLKKIVGRCNTC